MSKKFLVACFLLITSMTAHATIIQYKDYKRDSASNIVTGGGLEWLMWDVTKGMSIKQARATYSLQGWRLASNLEMASLFNGFSFGNDSWHVANNFRQNVSLPWTQVEGDSAHTKFIELFGETLRTSCALTTSTWCYNDDDPLSISTAFFGDDHPGALMWNIASVNDDYSNFGPNPYGPQEHTHNAIISEHGIWSHTANDEGAGVALVRSPAPPSTPVPLPGSISLLVFGMVALGYRRQVLRR